MCTELPEAGVVGDLRAGLGLPLVGVANWLAPADFGIITRGFSFLGGGF